MPRGRLPQGTDPSGIDYTVSLSRAEPFYAAIRAYLPGLQDGALQPAYSGVRPKVGLQGEGTAERQRVQAGSRGECACKRTAAWSRSPARAIKPAPLSQVVGLGQPPGDFVVAGPRQHGIARLVSLYGIESPGLTSALPLAQLAAERLAEAPA